MSPFGAGQSGWAERQACCSFGWWSDARYVRAGKIISSGDHDIARATKPNGGWRAAICSAQCRPRGTSRAGWTGAPQIVRTRPSPPATRPSRPRWRQRCRWTMRNQKGCCQVYWRTLSPRVKTYVVAWIAPSPRPWENTGCGQDWQACHSHPD